jgi:apolipoprotein N-acyltransferase
LRGGNALMPLQRVALNLLALTGWRRYLTAFLLGLLAAASLPPVDLTPVLLVSFGGLVWLADGSRNWRQAFALGWSFGAGFFLAGLYWIAVALTVDWRQFWWMMPFAVLGLPAVLGIFTGLALTASDYLSRRLHLSGTARIVMLALSWSVLEYVRGNVLTGFPWNLLGYAWAGGFPGGIAVLQAASIFGIYGLSFLTVLAASLPARLGAASGARISPALAALAVVAGLAAYGAWRLAENPRQDLPGITLRLVQPAIPEKLIHDRATLVDNFRLTLGLTQSPGFDKISAVIWPESGGPPFLDRDQDARLALARAAPPNGLVISGTVRGNKPPEPLDQFWNSLAVLDAKGDILATYDKHHLVPFGEYVPLRSVLPINKITPGTVDFTAGPGPATLTVPGLPPFSPLICYEAIFPETAVDPANRPAWLLNITNDAWYGYTSGPFQHLAIARLRAVEQGLPLARDGNNGVSAMIDPLGRVVALLGLDDVGVLDVPLPQSLSATPYAKFGDSLYLALLLLALAATALITATERNSRPGK